MKIAILVPGEPRFCKEFDVFLERLPPDAQIDWFFYLWKNSTYGGSRGLVSPNWVTIDRDWAFNKIKENLPAYHNIIRVEIGENWRDHFQTSITTGNVDSIFPMYSSLYLADKMRQEHELSAGKYDLVIRTRPDVGMLQAVDFNAIKSRIESEPTLVLMPDGQRYGNNVPTVNDMFAIASSNNMTIYSNLVNRLNEYHNAGVQFHPETLLSHHLRTNGLHFPPSGFDILLRALSREIDGKHVELSKIVDGKLYPNFDRWA